MIALLWKIGALVIAFVVGYGTGAEQERRIWASSLADKGYTNLVRCMIRRGRV